MRYLRYLILAVIGVGLVFVALANRATVALTLMPETFGNLFGFNYSIQVPLFVVIFAGVALGLLIGFIWEWMREMKHRSAVKQGHKKVVRLEREVSRLKSNTAAAPDDVLALLDTPK